MTGMKRKWVAVIALLACSGAANAGVTYTFTEAGPPGYPTTTFALTTADYVTSDTMFSNPSSWTFCGSSPGIFIPGATCTGIQFATSGLTDSSNDVIVYLSNRQIATTFGLGAFSQNGYYQATSPPHANQLGATLAVSGFDGPDPAVPEPATWAMMLLGFGFVGGAMRSFKRREKLAVSYA